MGVVGYCSAPSFCCVSTLSGLLHAVTVLVVFGALLLSMYYCASYRTQLGSEAVGCPFNALPFIECVWWWGRGLFFAFPHFFFLLLVVKRIYD